MKAALKLLYFVLMTVSLLYLVDKCQDLFNTKSTPKNIIAVLLEIIFVASYLSGMYRLFKISKRNNETF